MRCETRTGRFSIVVLLLVLVFSAWFAVPVSPWATADPVVTDLGNGNKSAVWNFTDPLDYLTTNVTLDPAGAAELDTTSGRLTHDSDSDFFANGVWDMANITVLGGSIVSVDKRAELIANGTFDAPSPWRYLNSSDTNVQAEWSAGNGTGVLFHDRPPTAAIHFDEMDTAFDANWTPALGGPNPPHGINNFQNDNTVYVEFNASAWMNIKFNNRVTAWAGLERMNLLGWDWTGYPTFSVWLNTGYSGPQVLLAYIHLESGLTQWDSAAWALSPGWMRYEFPIGMFPLLGSVQVLQIRFTNVTNTDLVDVWVDDIWLYRYENIAQSGSISQDVVKANFTDPTPGTVRLSFDYEVESPANLTTANITVGIDGWSAPPISVLNPAGWTRMTVDVSSVLAGTGTFNLSFVLDISLRTPFASTIFVQIDNVSATVPDYDGGWYESVPLDLGATVYFDQLRFPMSGHPDTGISVEVRSGFSNDTLDGSWTRWEQHNASPAILLGGGTGRFIQYRVILETRNASASVSLDWIEFTFHKYLDRGTVETFDFTSVEQRIGWRLFDAKLATPPQTSVSLSVSDDGGLGWTPVSPGIMIDFLGGSSIRVKADLATANTTATPRVTEFNVTYEYLGPLFTIVVSPPSWSGTADDQVQFTARGWDQFGHPISITPVWTDDDPVGSVDASGLYRPGQGGSWHVCASVTPVVDCANVTVAPGVLSSIIVTPSPVTVFAGDLQAFAASGSDADGNVVPLTSTYWSTDIGIFERVDTDSAVLRAKATPGVGQVVARQGPIAGWADVTVIMSTNVYINGQVPSQEEPEDSPPWSLNLSAYLPPAQSPNNLKWYIEGRDDSLYSVLGEGMFGHHTLWLIPKPDAFGEDLVTLWLENRTGLRDSQAMWVNITPVNDAPAFYDVPKLPLKHDVPYVFNYSPYIFDLDNPKNALILTTDALPLNAKVVGLTVNYTYDESFENKTVLVRLRVTDGQYSAETIQVITVTDNTPPHVIKPLPDVSMQEDVVFDDAFPEKLSNYFGDADGDQLFFSYGYSHLTVQFWGPAGDVHVRITPEHDWYGVDYLTIRASDSTQGLAEQTIRVTVSPVNDPPVLAWHDDLYVRYDVLCDLELADYVSDVDDSLSDLSLSTNRSDLSSVDVFTVHLLFPTGTPSSVPLSLSLKDRVATTWSNITVTAGTNEPPMLMPGMSLPDVTFNEDEQLVRFFNLSAYFFDPDAGPNQLSYVVEATTVTVSIDARDGYVNFSAPQDWNGEDLVRIKASDGLGFAIGKLAVRVVPVNDAPVISPIPDQDFGTGNMAVLDMRYYVHDVDNNITELLFSTNNNPRATIVGYMLILDYKSGGDSETVLLTVNDTRASTSRSFRVLLSKVPPVIEPPIWAQILWPWSLLILVAVGAIVAVAYNRALDRKYTVEDVFMVGREGRLIMHSTRHLRADRDEDILAGMLTAIMMFIRDSFKEEGEDLRKFEFGDRQVLVERGHHFYLAAIYAGEPPETAPESVFNFTADVEAEFGGILESWSGDADDIRGLRAFMEAFVSHRRYQRGDWKRFAGKRAA